MVNLFCPQSVKSLYYIKYFMLDFVKVSGLSVTTTTKKVYKEFPTIFFNLPYCLSCYFTL